MSETFTVTPLSDHIGAEVSGVNLRAPLDESLRQVLRQSLDKHLFLLFRNQEIGVGDQMRLVESFMPLYDELEDGSYYYYFDDGAMKDDRVMSSMRSGKTLHADFMWTPFPLPLISLYAVDCNDSSGATRFANASKVASQLTDDQLRRLGDLRAVHARWDLSPLACAAHPVITRHPRTGNPALYISEIFTKEIEGLDQAAGQSVIDECFAVLRQEQYTYDHHWRQGDLLLWDNLAVVHARMPSSEVSPRILRRVSGAEKTFAEMLPDAAARDAYCTSLMTHVRPGVPIG